MSFRGEVSVYCNVYIAADSKAYENGSGEERIVERRRDEQIFAFYDGCFAMLVAP